MEKIEAQKHANNFLNNKLSGEFLMKANRGWLLICVISLSSTSFLVIHAHPSYLQDWHAAAIILLSTLVMILYIVSIFLWRILFDFWPPPRIIAISVWSSMYAAILVLSWIDSAFSWNLFTVLGITFALFVPPYTFCLVFVIFLSWCLANRLIILPFTWDNIGSIVGVGISFLATTAFSHLVQNLIHERFERNRLLQQLSTVNTDLEIAHQRLAASAVHEQELAVLRERTRLAREMHDTLGHALVLVSVKLEAAQRLRLRDGERCDRELEQTKEIVRHSMSELRASIANLRSPALEKTTLGCALAHHVSKMALRTGWRVTDEIANDIGQLPEEIEETLWKIGQEALTNVERHAQAQNVSVHLQRQDATILLKIQDDGIGLPQEYYQQYHNLLMPAIDHYGIDGMIERAERVGGSILMCPASRGTIIEVRLPLSENALE